MGNLEVSPPHLPPSSSHSFTFLFTGAIALARSISTCAQLTHIDVSHTHAGSEGLAAWLSSIGSLCFLRHLDLSDNYVASPGPGNALPVGNLLTLGGSTLARLSALTYLDLSRNLLGPAFALSVGPSLQQLRHLEYLNVCRNVFGDSRVVGLATYLSGLERLRVLNVSHNEIQRKEVTHAELARLMGHIEGLCLIEADSDSEDGYYAGDVGIDWVDGEDQWWDDYDDGFDEPMVGMESD